MVDQTGEGVVVKVEGVDGTSGFKLKFKTNFFEVSKRASLFHRIWHGKRILFSLIWAKKYMYFPESWQILVTVKFKSMPNQMNTAINSKSNIIHYASDNWRIWQILQKHRTVKNLGITKLLKTRESRVFVRLLQSRKSQMITGSKIKAMKLV